MRESLLRLCKDIKESGPKSPEIQSSSPKESQKVKKLKEMKAVIPKIEKVEEPEEDDWWIQNQFECQKISKRQEKRIIDTY